jgi:hypothetical protein
MHDDTARNANQRRSGKKNNKLRRRRTFIANWTWMYQELSAMFVPRDRKYQISH